MSQVFIILMALVTASCHGQLMPRIEQNPVANVVVNVSKSHTRMSRERRAKTCDRLVQGWQAPGHGPGQPLHSHSQLGPVHYFGARRTQREVGLGHVSLQGDECARRGDLYRLNTAGHLFEGRFQSDTEESPNQCRFVVIAFIRFFFD